MSKDCFETISKLEQENKALKNRCYVLSRGVMCFYCHFECEHRTCNFRNNTGDSEE